MATTAQKLEIINPALRRLRHPGLTTLDTAATETIEKLVANDWEGIVKEVLEHIPWACVSKRNSSLTSDSDHVNDQYTYGFSLPSDFIRLVGEPLYSGSSVPQYSDCPQHWRIVGDILETMFAGPDILYVYYDSTDSTDTYLTLFDNNLKETIRALMQVRWCFAITGDGALEQKKEQAFERQLRRARGLNSRKMHKLIEEHKGLLYRRLGGW